MINEMQDTLTTSALTPLEAAVLEVIVYADLFDSALTPEEIRRWLAVPASPKDVEDTLAGPNLASLIANVPPYVTLAGRESAAAVRERRCISSETLRSRAERYGDFMARLPFVRMVAITGALAVDNADDGDDLDYLIVTTPGRVWLTRAMIMAIGRVAARRGATLCPNYLLAETALALPANDYYTARELLQMQLVSGQAVYERMLAANAWWHIHLPNFTRREERARFATNGRAPSLLRQGAEWFLRLPPFDAVERWILTHKGEELRRNAGDEAIFDETMCKGHFDRWRERTQRRLEERMRQLLEATT
jgi:hypothetical protein